MGCSETPGRSPSIKKLIGAAAASTRGQVINGSLGQLLKNLAAAPSRAGKGKTTTEHSIGDEAGWTTERSLGEVGTTSVHSKPLFACNDRS